MISELKAKYKSVLEGNFSTIVEEGASTIENKAKDSLYITCNFCSTCLFTRYPIMGGPHVKANRSDHSLTENLLLTSNLVTKPTAISVMMICRPWPDKNLYRVMFFFKKKDIYIYMYIVRIYTYRFLNFLRFDHVAINPSMVQCPVARSHPLSLDLKNYLTASCLRQAERSRCPGMVIYRDPHASLYI